jgi:hypothetical protein
MVVVVCRGQDGGWNDSKKEIIKRERKKWSGRNQIRAVIIRFSTAPWSSNPSGVNLFVAQHS